VENLRLPVCFLSKYSCLYSTVIDGRTKVSMTQNVYVLRHGFLSHQTVEYFIQTLVSSLNQLQGSQEQKATLQKSVVIVVETHFFRVVFRIFLDVA
jgi:hypothetical protein